MADYKSNKTCEVIDAILDSATPKGEVGDAPEVLSLQGARSYAEALSKASLIYAGNITALYGTGWATIGAKVEISDAFKAKYGDNAPTITEVVLVDKVVSGNTPASTTRFLYSGDYEGCYFVMGDFEGNDTVFDLGAAKGDWIIAQNKSWAKIVTTRRDIAGIEGEVTAEKLVNRLSTATADNTKPLATKEELSGFVKGVKVNDEVKIPDTNGVVDLGNVSSEVSEEQIASLGFTKNKGTVTKIADVLPDEYGHISAEELSKKLDIGGNTATSVNFANDLTGRIEATPEMFTYRPSAGDKSVRDESAVIRRIKGNTSLWGQLAFASNYSSGGLQFKYNNDGTIELNGTVTSAVHIGKVDNINAHKYLSICEVLSMGNMEKFSFGNLNNYYERASFTGVGEKYLFANGPTSSANYIGLTDFPLGTRISNVIIRYQRFDLTDIFGAGNEPTTLEAFRACYPESYYPYCAPEIRSMRATGIETIGFNAFNGEYAEVIGGQAYYLGVTIDTAHFATEIGGEMTEITIPENRLYTPSENGYIYATGSNICINLSHSGVRNGEYEEYEKNTLLLPEIAKYFPDGMHGIGDVCDEINEEWAIQRCAVRSYEAGDGRNTKVKTDGVNTVYILDVPVYTPIDELLQLYYRVDDFGTERMLCDEPSSPFKADIVYQFNAEGRIRDNSRNIEKLEEAVKKLENNDASSQYAMPRIKEKINDLSELQPNVVYENTESALELHIPSLTKVDHDVINKWIVRAGVADGCEITYSTSIRWKNGTPPTYAGNKILELIFTDGIGNIIFGEWNVY